MPLISSLSVQHYQSKYLAHLLSLRYASDADDKFAATVAGAQVDMNPHQVEAALFAFKSPLSNGAILADEVGLGKTIEAGILLSQKWAQHQRKILIIVPSNLRKQWMQELAEKFFLSSTIFEAKNFNAALKAGSQNPFLLENESIAICSYHFARNKDEYLARVPWDLVVIDEAHRLRNVYKKNNVIANKIKIALKNRPKVLLTATPLQNSLQELFGLVSFIDEHAFGSLPSFKKQFSNLGNEDAFSALKERLAPLCHRTLRRQVGQYVSYTARHAMIEEFTPEDDEDQLYDLVSEYLQRPEIQALPAGQRSLMTLILRKLLASSTFAIAGALRTMSNRLAGKMETEEARVKLQQSLVDDFEGIDSELLEDDDEPEPDPLLTPEEIEKLAEESAELAAFADLAEGIYENGKGNALISALNTAVPRVTGLGGAEKALIFTESRRTQDYLYGLLSATEEWADHIVLFNGSNTDAKSKTIYAEWLSRHRDTNKFTGSRTADMRSALVEYFRDEGKIMIATEAGAEGINLQFCSLVINYDLPWNPQRVEQRIGRCHRYGQKHDVVVVNFINKKNAADRRVYELLSEKFQLFEGVFGASDEVLGAIGSGVDFEKRIASIYQDCRDSGEIKQAFDELQLELKLEIDEAFSSTREKLLEHFDDEVREKLRERQNSSKEALSKHEKQLIDLIKIELAEHIEAVDESSFYLRSVPQHAEQDSSPLGLYELPRRSGNAHLFRHTHPLAQLIIDQAKSRNLPLSELHFSYTTHKGNISSLEPYLRQSGWLTVSRFSIDSLGQKEDYLIHSLITDSGETLSPELAQRLLTLPVSEGFEILEAAPASLEELTLKQQKKIQFDISERNANFFEKETTKLDHWADDLKLGLESEIKEIDAAIREARKAGSLSSTLEDKIAAQKLLKKLETKRKEKRRSLFDAQDDIDEQRDELISNIEQKLGKSTTTTDIFTIRWKMN